MADTPTPPLSLKDLIDLTEWSITGVSPAGFSPEGKTPISPGQVILLAHHYDELRDVTVGLFIADPEAFKEKTLEAISKLREKPEHILTETPKEAPPPKEVATLGETYETAIARQRATLTPLKERSEKERRAFIEALAKNFPAQVARALKEEELRRGAEESINRASPTRKPLSANEQLVTTLRTQTGASDAVVATWIQKAEAQAPEAAGAIFEHRATTEALTAAMKEAVEYPVPNPDHILETTQAYIRAAITQNKDIDPRDVGRAAIMETRAEAAFSARSVDAPAPASSAMRSLSRGLMRSRMMNPVVDVVFALFPKATEAAIAQAVVGKFQAVIKNADALEARFGKTFVDSQEFQLLIKNSAQGFDSQKTAGRAVLDGFGKIAASAGAYALGGIPDEAALAYIDHIQKSALARAAGHPPAAADPGFYQLFIASLYAKNPQQFHVHHLEGTEFALRLLTQKAEQKAAGGLFKSIFASIFGKQAAAAGAGATIGATIGSGGTALIAAGLSFLTSRAGKLLNGFLDFLTARKSDPRHDGARNLSLFLVILLGLMVIPIMFQRMFSIVNWSTSYQGGGSQSVGPGYSGGSPTDSDIAGCPTSYKGRITYCPFSLSGNVKIGDTHANADAYDIAMPQGTPVQSTHDGVVTIAGSNGGYGIMVAVRATDSRGQEYETWYGHFSAVKVSVGQRVSKGTTLLGYSGQTGNVTGPHLHYEYRIVPTGETRSTPPPRPGIKFLPASCGYPNPLGCQL